MHLAFMAPDVMLRPRRILVQDLAALFALHEELVPQAVESEISRGRDLVQLAKSRIKIVGLETLAIEIGKTLCSIAH
jgi:hypothetical protein